MYHITPLPSSVSLFQALGGRGRAKKKNKQARETNSVVADTLSGTQKVFLILFRNILCPQQIFPSMRSPRNIMGNNVSATMCPRLPGPLFWVKEIADL